MTYEHWLGKVQQDGWMLMHVPEAHRTVDLCRLAVQNDGDALQYVPAPLRSAEICLAAVKSPTAKLMPLLNVPNEQRTPELCLAAVEQAGWP